MSAVQDQSTKRNFMCGRYGRRSDKQKIDEAFHANAYVDHLSLAPDGDISPGKTEPSSA